MYSQIAEQNEIWTLKKCIALAKLLEKKPCLWSKPQSMDMKTLFPRRKAAIGIARALNVSHAQARQKIDNLKTHFQRELAKKLSNESYESEWYLFKHLQFLNTNKKIKTNINFTPPKENDVNEAEKWTQKKCIALAKLWEQKPCLWSQNKGRHATTSIAKHEATISIAQALNVSHHAVRKKMCYIKKQFQAQQKKPNKTWYLLKHLKFLNTSSTMKIETNTDFTPSTENKVIEYRIWTRQECIALAKLWEQKPCLWSPKTDGRPKTLKARHEATISIARALNVSYHQVRRKINRIKKELAQIGKKRSNKPWYLLKHLKFLNNIENIETNTDFIPSTEHKVTEAEVEIWTPEKCVALAKLWEQKPCLWIWRQGKDEYVKTVKARRDAEVSIAQALNISCHEVHMKMNSIKAIFRQHQRKLTNKTYTPKWYLFEHLKFLNSTMTSETNIDFATSTQNTAIETQKVQSPSHAHDPGQDEVQDDHLLLNDEIDTATSMENIMGEAEELLSLFNAQYPAQDNVQQNDLLNDGIDSGTFTKNKVTMESKEVQSHRRISKEDQDHQSQSCKACEKRKAEYATLSTTLKHWEESISSSSTSAAEQTQDQWDLFGALVAKKMRNLRNATSQIHTERAINQILFKYQTEEQENVSLGARGTREKFTS